MRKTKEIKKEMDCILIELEKMYSRKKELETNIARLTQLGCQDFKEYWTGKEKKYLYKLFKMMGGKRRKEYVGSRPIEIERAREQQMRFDVRAAQTDTLFEIERRIGQLEDFIHQATLLCDNILGLY